MLDDGLVGHAADGLEIRDGAIEGFGGEVAEGEHLVFGEAGGAKLLVGAVEEMLGGGVDSDAADVVEGLEQAAVDGGGGFAVELLIDDGFGEGFEGGLGGGELHGEGAGACDEFAEFGVGGGEVRDGGGGVVGGLAGSGGVRHGDDVNRCVVSELRFV